MLSEGSLWWKTVLLMYLPISYLHGGVRFVALESGSQRETGVLRVRGDSRVEDRQSSFHSTVTRRQRLGN